MSVWERDESSKTLVKRVTMTDSTNTHTPIPTIDMGDYAFNHRPRTLQERCYSIPSLSSCIRLPYESRYNFEIDHELISLLPRFTGLEDVYIFLREFEEVCALMNLDPQSEDILRLRLIPFALRDDAKM